jgi:hypothetical protein
MSTEEAISIARVEQKVKDMDDTMTAFVSEIRAWKTDIDRERNKVKGALAVVGVLGGLVGGLLGWIGRNIRFSA